MVHLQIWNAETCENLNIDVKHTAADSPMQNGL